MPKLDRVFQKNATQISLEILKKIIKFRYSPKAHPFFLSMIGGLDIFTELSLNWYFIMCGQFQMQHAVKA